MTDPDLLPLLRRIADALERLAPPEPPATDLDCADAFVWHADPGWLEPVRQVNRVEIGLLRGIDRVRDILLDNTERFAAGFPANNVLLWGARGTGKSSLVKAAHAAVNDRRPRALALVEIHREDIPSLPRLLSLRRGIRSAMRELRPDVFVGIDAPEFNLGLASDLHEAGLRLCALTNSTQAVAEAQLEHAGIAR